MKGVALKEVDIQRQICDYLAMKKHFFWRQNNTPVFDPSKGTFRAMPKYSMMGLPDIMVVTDGGFMVFLEIKAPKGQMSPHQKEFKRRCEEKGAEYYCVKSLDEVIEIGL